MSVEDNKALVQCFFNDAANAGNLALLDRMGHPTFRALALFLHDEERRADPGATDQDEPEGWSASPGRISGAPRRFSAVT